jgi:hypothetical protein
MFEKKKKMMIASITFFNGCRLFQWFCYKECDSNNAIAFFNGGDAMKKVMATSYRCFFSFFGPFGLVHYN